MGVYSWLRARLLARCRRSDLTLGRLDFTCDCSPDDCEIPLSECFRRGTRCRPHLLHPASLEEPEEPADEAEENEADETEGVVTKAAVGATDGPCCCCCCCISILDLSLIPEITGSDWGLLEDPAGIAVFPLLIDDWSLTVVAVDRTEK